MKRLLFPILAIAAAAVLHAAPDKPTPTPATAPASTPAADASSAEAQARSAALELVGAFSNDGYKIRDGFYFGALEPDKGVVIEVNLFAGNEYWFCAAANEPARKIAVKVYDEDGAPVEQQYYSNGASAAAGVVAAVSGKYLVKVTLAEGGKSQFCFLYCYK
jgi:hypothetical protein